MASEYAALKQPRVQVGRNIDMDQIETPAEGQFFLNLDNANLYQYVSDKWELVGWGRGAPYPNDAQQRMANAFAAALASGGQGGGGPSPSHGPGDPPVSYPIPPAGGGCNPAFGNALDVSVGKYTQAFPSNTVSGTFNTNPVPGDLVIAAVINGDFNHPSVGVTGGGVTNWFQIASAFNGASSYGLQGSLWAGICDTTVGPVVATIPAVSGGPIGVITAVFSGAEVLRNVVTNQSHNVAGGASGPLVMPTIAVVRSSLAIGAYFSYNGGELPVMTGLAHADITTNVSFGGTGFAISFGYTLLPMSGSGSIAVQYAISTESDAVSEIGMVAVFA